MLELQNVTGGYGDTIVLRNVDIYVPDGDVVALLGPNGAGKTTTLRMVSGLLKPTSGAVTVNGDDISYMSPSERTKLGICHIPEGRGIFPNLTVRDNLVVQAAGLDIDDVIGRAAAAFPILGRRLTQQAGTLSGGEQQMLALVRAYDPRASLVLVDEASLGLAPIVVDGIFEFLAGITAEGKAILLVEQYVTRALEMANYVYLLAHGRVVHEGEPDELRDEDVLATYMGETAV